MPDTKLIIVLFSVILITVSACPKDCSKSEITRYCGNLNTSSPNYSVLCFIRITDQTLLRVYCNRNDNSSDRVLFWYDLYAMKCDSTEFRYFITDDNSDPNISTLSPIDKTLIFMFGGIISAILLVFACMCCDKTCQYNSIEPDDEGVP